MKAEVFQGNLARTLHSLYDQTGKVPGGPTGMCLRVLRGTLTGKEINFAKDLPATEADALLEEQDAPILQHQIRLDGISPLAALPILLEQKRMPYDAIMVIGRRPLSKSTHAIAIIQNDSEDRYIRIDSFDQNGFSAFNTTAEVVSSVTDRFEEVVCLYWVAEEEHRREPNPTVNFVDKLIPIEKGISIVSRIPR